MDHPARTIELFNQEIPIRKYGCQHKNDEIKIIEPARLNLFIQLTHNCNAKCNFCEYHGNKIINFDIVKLQEIITEISSKIHFGKINFTGGEPMLDMKLFDNVMNCVETKAPLNKGTEITVNTNGIHLMELINYQNIITNISISHHHYNDEKNYEIFQTRNVASNKDILLFQEKNTKKAVTQIRCNLIKGYIDNYYELKTFLDEMIKLKCSDCGFVTLMPLNEYCNNHQINFIDLINNKDDDIIKVNYWHRFEKEQEVCQCANYLYNNEKGQTCKFYSRLFCNSSLTDGQLTYDGQYLRLGFGGKIIY